MTELKPDRSNPEAPFGRDEDGTPKAPYGLKVDGTPRSSRRGALPGQRGVGNSSGARGRKPPGRPGVSAASKSLTDTQRKGMLLDLASNLLVTPLASLSQVPFLRRYIGTRHTDALAGDALILDMYAPAIADGLIIYSKSRPKTLAWMEKIEDNAGLIILAQAAIQAGKQIADNHIRPNPAVAEAGRNLAAMRVAQMAEEINRQAAAMRPDTPPADPFPGPAAEEPTVVFEPVAA